LQQGNLITEKILRKQAFLSPDFLRKTPEWSGRFGLTIEGFWSDRLGLTI